MDELLAAEAQPPARLLVGFSGGADSTALLELCARRRDEAGAPQSLLAAHLDHGLRGAAGAGDAEFCAGFCRARGIELISERADVAQLAQRERLGLEAAGRQARQELFVRAIAGRPAAVLLAHQADDQVETMLLNLLRGCGARGLTGLRARRELAVGGGRLLVWRPLLDFSHAQLTEYLSARGLAWREDETNADPSFKRNQLRAELLPVLGRIAPHYRESFARLARNLAPLAEREEQEARIEAEAAFQRNDGGVLVNGDLSLAAWRWLLEHELGAGTEDGAADALAEFSAGSRRARQLPGGLHAVRDTDGIFIARARTRRRPAAAEIVLPAPPFDLPVPEGRLCGELRPVRRRPPPADQADPNVEWLAAEALRPPLVWRSPRPGESFVPLGAPGHKLVADLVAEAKLPRRRRDRARVLADAEGILWVWPVRLAQRARLGPQTTQAWRLALEPDFSTAGTAGDS